MRYISGVWEPITATSANHLPGQNFRILYTLSPLLFCICCSFADLYFLHKLCLLSLYFFPFYSTVFVEQFGAQRELVVCACGTCSLQKLSNYEWASGRGMIGCPFRDPGSDARGLEEALCLWAEVWRSFPRAKGTKFGKQRA